MPRFASQDAIETPLRRQLEAPKVSKMALKSVQNCSWGAPGECFEAIWLRNPNFLDFGGLRGGPWELLGLLREAPGASLGSKRSAFGVLGHHFSSSGRLLECIAPQKLIPWKCMVLLRKSMDFRCLGTPRSSQNRSRITFGGHQNVRWQARCDAKRFLRPKACTDRSQRASPEPRALESPSQNPGN